MFSIKSIFIVVIWLTETLSSLLAWPAVVYVWTRVVRQRSAKSTLRVTIIVGTLLAPVEPLVTLAIFMRPHSWLRHHSWWLLPVVWIVVPVSVIVLILIVNRKRLIPFQGQSPTSPCGTKDQPVGD